MLDDSDFLDRWQISLFLLAMVAATDFGVQTPPSTAYQSDLFKLRDPRRLRKSRTLFIVGSTV